MLPLCSNIPSCFKNFTNSDQINSGPLLLVKVKTHFSHFTKKMKFSYILHLETGFVQKGHMPSPLYGCSENTRGQFDSTL